MTRATVFAAEDFRTLVLQGAAQLLARGFEFLEADASAVTIQATPVQVRFTQDRGGQVDAQIRAGHSPGFVGLHEIARYLNLPREPGVFCSDRAAAITAIGSFADFLAGPALPWLCAEETAWSELSDWLEVDRPLRTQHFTRVARPERTWSLIMGAWEDRRFGNALKLLRALPLPRSEAEDVAIAYCARMLKSDS